MPGAQGYDTRIYPGQSRQFADEDEDAAPTLPTFSGGGSSLEHEENDDVGSCHQEASVQDSAFVPPPPTQPQSGTSFNAGSSVQAQEPQHLNAGQSSEATQMLSSVNDAAQLHAATAKEKFMSFTADARLGAQVMRVQTGVDAKLQAVRDHKGVRNLLSKVGIGKSPAAAGIACEPPQGAAGEVLDLFQEDPSMRDRIVNFHQTQAHLDDLLPALQDYQRHRQGLADAERRLATCLKEHGVRNAGTYGQALQTSADMHLQASVRRLEAYEKEEKHVTSVMISHRDQASHDCKLAVQAYEASRQEVRLLYEAREISSSTKQRLQESGVNRVDSKIAPQVEAGFEKVVAAAKEKLQATATTAGVKVAMLEAKHGLDYAVALAYHMKNVANEEQDISGMYGAVDESVAALEESASRASLDITETQHSACYSDAGY